MEAINTEEDKLLWYYLITILTILREPIAFHKLISLRKDISLKLLANPNLRILLIILTNPKNTWPCRIYLIVISVYYWLWFWLLYCWWCSWSTLWNDCLKVGTDVYLWWLGFWEARRGQHVLVHHLLLGHWWIVWLGIGIRGCLAFFFITLQKCFEK